MGAKSESGSRLSSLCCACTHRGARWTTSLYGFLLIPRNPQDRSGPSRRTNRRAITVVYARLMKQKQYSSKVLLASRCSLSTMWL
jgi:hypothetical protein